MKIDRVKAKHTTMRNRALSPKHQLLFVFICNQLNACLFLFHRWEYQVMWYCCYGYHIVIYHAQQLELLMETMLEAGEPEMSIFCDYGMANIAWPMNINAGY